MSNNVLVRAEFYGKCIVDKDDALDLVNQVREEKERLNINELPVSHDWYGVETLEDAVKHLARQMWIDEPDQWDLSLESATPDFK